MDATTLAAPVIATWGVYGVILIVAVIAIVFLAKALLGSYKERLAETRETLTLTLKNSADTAQALRDMKTTVDAVIGMLKGKG